MNTPFELPPLPYGYAALEPYIDEQTMVLHHQKHMAAYVNNLNETLAGCPKCYGLPLEQLLLRAQRFPRKTATAILNNAGGVYNHRFYFEGMSPLHGQLPPQRLLAALEKQFGTYERFIGQLRRQALGVFGSGWVWLVISRRGGLELMNTQNQLTPIGSGYLPLFCLDVWEHAYYLGYQNRRGDYVDGWIQVINWEKVGERYLTHLRAIG